MSAMKLRELANPDVRHDYVVRLEGDVGGTRLTVHYVPDRSIVGDGDFQAYVATCRAAPHETPEALAATVLEDVNNALVPRWVRITVTCPGHAVLIEDSQPDWENETLISALAPF